MGNVAKAAAAAIAAAAARGSNTAAAPVDGAREGSKAQGSNTAAAAAAGIAAVTAKPDAIDIAAIGIVAAADGARADSRAQGSNNAAGAGARANVATKTEQKHSTACSNKINIINNNDNTEKEPTAGHVERKTDSEDTGNLEAVQAPDNNS